MEHKKIKKKEEKTFRVWILWKNYKRRINFVTTVPRFPLNTPSTSVPRERGTVPQPCHAVPIFPPASQDSMISNRPAGNITESFDFSLIETNLRSPIVERGNKFSTRSDRRFDRSPIPRWLDRPAPHGVRAFFARINFPWRGVETNAHSGSPVGRDPGGITSRLTEIRLSKFSIIGSRL